MIGLNNIFADQNHKRVVPVYIILGRWSAMTCYAIFKEHTGVWPGVKGLDKFINVWTKMETAIYHLLKPSIGFPSLSFLSLLLWFIYVDWLKFKCFTHLFE